MILLFGTACSVLNKSQSSTHPLVNEVDRNKIVLKQSYKSPKKSKEQTYSTQQAVKTVPEKNPISENQVNPQITSKPEEKISSKLENRSSTLKEIQKNLIAEAEKYLGTPYKIGGTSVNGIDCSGLVMVVFQKQGIQLPRISLDQYKFGTPLQIHEIEPGDLLFFSTPSQPHQIGHSAMCVDIENGKIKFIHAASTGVRYDYLVPGYYLKHYKGACRVLNNSLSSTQ